MRAVGLVVSMIGLFIFAMLMGFVFDLITVNMEELRKGKSMVVEKDHTLILGWSDKLYTILLELCDANESRPDGTMGGVIVILATPGEGMCPETKDDMIAELDERIDEERRKCTKFVIRVGSPMLASDLAKVADHHHLERRRAELRRVRADLAQRVHPPRMTELLRGTGERDVGHRSPPVARGFRQVADA